MLEVRANKKKSIHQLPRCILMAAVHLSVMTSHNCCLLTDVDRVRTHSVTPGSSPERHREGMGQTNYRHAGKGKEPEA